MLQSRRDKLLRYWFSYVVGGEVDIAEQDGLADFLEIDGTVNQTLRDTDDGAGIDNMFLPFFAHR